MNISDAVRVIEDARDDGLPVAEFSIASSTLFRHMDELGAVGLAFARHPASFADADGRNALGFLTLNGCVVAPMMKCSTVTLAVVDRGGQLTFEIIECELDAEGNSRRVITQIMLLSQAKLLCMVVVSVE